jgi:hypothetical protein
MVPRRRSSRRKPSLKPSGVQALAKPCFIPTIRSDRFFQALGPQVESGTLFDVVAVTVIHARDAAIGVIEDASDHDPAHAGAEYA